MRMMIIIIIIITIIITGDVGGRHNMPRPCKLTFDLQSDVRVMCDVGYLWVP